MRAQDIPSHDIRWLDAGKRQTQSATHFAACLLGVTESELKRPDNSSEGWSGYFNRNHWSAPIFDKAITINRFYPPLGTEYYTLFYVEFRTQSQADRVARAALEMGGILPNKGPLERFRVMKSGKALVYVVYEYGDKEDASLERRSATASAWLDFAGECFNSRP